VFLCEGGLHGFRRGRNRGASVRTGELHKGRVKHVVHREENHVERLLAMFLLDQVVDVRDTDPGWETGINVAARCTGAVEFGTRVVGVDDVLRLHAEALEIRVEERSVGVDGEDARDAEAEFLAILHERAALSRAFAPSGPSARGKRISYVLRVGRPEYFLGRIRSEEHTSELQSH